MAFCPSHACGETRGDNSVCTDAGGIDEGSIRAGGPGGYVLGEWGHASDCESMVLRKQDCEHGYFWRGGWEC